MKTIQEILEGLRTGTIQEWLKQAKADLEKAKHLFAYESNLAKLTEYHTQYHTTVWAIRALQSELKRRNELADANRKRLGLDQPDLGESLWLEGYGEQLDPDQERRLATLSAINRKRVGLPPKVETPKEGWVELELSNGDKLLKVCGNCVNWGRGGAGSHQKEPDDGWCSHHDSYCNATSITCPRFDPIPLPQTPPAEAVKTAESLINVCGNCIFHFHKQDSDGFCSKLGRKMPPTNPVDPCVHFRSKRASERAVAALDHLPTPEEFDPNDPRR